MPYIILRCCHTFYKATHIGSSKVFYYSCLGMVFYINVAGHIFCQIISVAENHFYNDARLLADCNMFLGHN